MLFLLKLYQRLLNIVSPAGIGRIPGIGRIGRAAKAKLFRFSYEGLPGKDRPSRFCKMYIGSIASSGVSHCLSFDRVSLIAARHVRESGKVYAFESEPDNYKLLARNVALNNYTNIVAVQKAVSDKSGKRTLFVSRLSHDHSFTEQNIAGMARLIHGILAG